MTSQSCRNALLVALISLTALFLSGCSTPGLKGTPYYSTATDSDARSAKERIPLWPIVYYRSPTLSVLWPFFEKSDEFMALRPLASVYGLDQPKKIYSLLWPLGQFDRVEKVNRFFPVFWGKEYVVGFPLYWHFDHPLGPDGGTDALIPLWWYSTNRQGYSFNLVWPLMNVQNRPESKGWRLWPLVGSYSHQTDGYYRFAAWPLAHQWGSRASQTHGEAVLPLYVRHTSPDRRLFVSLPYSRQRSASKQWDLLLPVFYNSRNATESKTITLLGGMQRDRHGMGWVAVPLLSGGKKTPTGSSTWLLGPLAHFGHSPGISRRHVFPFFYSGVDRSGQLFLSIPWSSGSTRDGRKWQLIPPLMLRTADNKDHRLITPIYSAGTSHGATKSWQTVVPLWYRSQGAGEKMLATALGGWQTGADGRRWLIWPLLSFGQKGRDSRDVWVVAPLFHARRDQAGLSSHLLPLYWWNAHDKAFLSLAVSKWGNSTTGQKTTVIPPALTLYASEPKKKDLWALAGAAHFSWGEEPGSSHILPLYYQDRSEGTFLSLPWSSWTWNNHSTNTLIAPALSWMTRREERSDLWALGPMAHFSWGKDAGAFHIVPLFYRNKPNHTFVSLPYAHWEADQQEHDLYPPLLSLYSKEGRERRLVSLLGLFSERWGNDLHEGYFIPFYYHDHWQEFYSLLFGWNRDADTGFFYPLTPLVGLRTGRHTGGWVFPFWSRHRDPDAKQTTGTVLWGSYRSDGQRTESSIIPIYGYKNRGALPAVMPTNSMGASYGKTFWSLPAIWYRNTVELKPAYRHGNPTGQVERSSVRDHGFFPLWTYTHQMTPLGGDETYGSILLCLYNFKSALKPKPEANQPQEVHIRNQILWRFYHFERNNEDVSVDIFPAITYDRTRDGFRRWAFLWRAFRYERGPEGRKLDLLFVPLMRSPAAPATDPLASGKKT